MKNKYFFLLVLAACSVFMTSCDKEDPDITNGEELITTVNYELTPDDGGAAITLSFVDLDGDGGNAPVITGGTLSANTTYSGSMDLLNESETPAEVITAEIMEEDDEHQFFFETDISGLTVAYADEDGNMNPVGLTTTLTTGDAGSGSLTITLRHEPDKSGSGVAAGDITNAGGETDIEVTFPIDVE